MLLQNSIKVQDRNVVDILCYNKYGLKPYFTDFFIYYYSAISFRQI